VKTFYKVILGIFAFVLVLILYFLAARSVARQAAESFRDGLLAKYGQPTYDPSANLFTTQINSTSAVDLTSLYRDFGNIPQLMRQLPSGRARVAWQQEELAVIGTFNVWPRIQALLDARETEIQTLVESVDPESGMSASERANVAGHGAVAGAWLSTAMAMGLHVGEEERALAYLKAILRFEQSTNAKLAWNGMTQSRFGALWEFLQHANHTEAALEDLSELVEADQPTNRFDAYFCVGISTISGTISYVREGGAEAMMGLPASAWALFPHSIHSWGGFFRALTADPKAAFAWLSLKGKYAKYCWRTAYDDEVWSLRNLEIDWDGLHVGIKSGAMTNGLAWAHAERKKHGPPGADLLWSQAMFAMSAGTGSAIQEHANMLTQAVADEVRHRLMLTALAVHRYRIRQGRFPERLTDLVPTLLPTVPIDYLDGQPMRYELRNEDSFRLWSIGCYDGDNQGDARPHSSHGSSVAYGFMGGGAWAAAKDWVWPGVADSAEVATDAASLGSRTAATVHPVTSGTSP
jgi:hypothetical protein